MPEAQGRAPVSIQIPTRGRGGGGSGRSATSSMVGASRSSVATPSATHPRLMDSMSIDGSGAVVTPAARNKLSAAAARAAMKNGTAATGNSAGDLSIRRLARQFLETNAEVGRSKVLAQDMGWLSKDANELEEKNMWTVQRAADFEVFKATTPMWKQLGSIVLMPLLAFTLGLSVHMAPMGHVSDGPAANWVHTFDVMWGSFVSYQVPVALVRAFTRCPISVRKNLIATLPSSLLSGVLAYGLQIIWGYPLPFLPVIACFPGYMLSLAITYFLMPKAFKKFKATRRQLTAAIVIGQLTLGILAIWSIHRTIFVQIEDRPILQALMTLLLPIMKMVFRTTFAKIGQYVHIDLGPVMVFIVEAFSAFFNAMLFNNSGVFASILLISFDVITNAYYVYMLCRGYMPQGVKGFAKSVRRRMSTFSSSRAVNPAPLHATTSGDVPHSRTSVASSHRSSVDANDADDAAAAGAAAPGPLIALAEGRSASGDSDSDDMDAITAANTAANSNGGASANKGTTNKAAVVAMPTTRQKNIDLVTRWASRKKEFLFLAEYAETFVPITYLAFMLFAYYGYNRHAFIGFADMDESRLLSSARLVGILIVTEIVGMAAVGYSLHKKFGSNPITYLAFTLKKHTLVMLYATALNTAFTIALIVQHNGCDFTFDFSWLKDEAAASS